MCQSNDAIPMPKTPLDTQDAAGLLGISRATLYDWLGRSDRGTLLLQGQPVVIDYVQTGGKGQGRIQIESSEVDRIRDLMRVRPQRIVSRRAPKRQIVFPGITVRLGHPGRQSKS